MQLQTTFCMLMAVVTASSARRTEEIVRNDFETPNADGTYRWALQTEGGIFHEQRGYLQPKPNGEPSLVMEGQYQYTAPNGQVIRVLYRADENGFQPSGSHLPTLPSAVPVIRRAIEFLATQSPPTADY